MPSGLSYQGDLMREPCWAPEVVYSPIVPVKVFETNRSEPETAMPTGPLNPETKAGFTVAPEVVYSPIVPIGPLFAPVMVFVTKI